ncbi:hypothetical protein JOL62DRAFT_282021 [Phyllosticta paracitricarpa]|uniref:Uncharacterized protein n=1 Tax=Phyllosticta paracitricarpa TaxID=2016321 RepID=A0ABR1MXH0_9PEZI
MFLQTHHVRARYQPKIVIMVPNPPNQQDANVVVAKHISKTGLSGLFFSFLHLAFAIDYLPSPSVPVHVLLAFSLCRNQAAVHRPRNIVGHAEPIYVGASQVPGKRCPEPEKSFLLFAKTYHKAAEPDLHSAAAYPSIRPSVQTSSDGDHPKDSPSRAPGARHKSTAPLDACGASGRRGARLRRTSARCRWTPSSLSCLVTLPARLPCHCRHGITRLSPRLVSPRLASFGWLARSLHVTLSVLSGLCVGPAPCIHWLACSFGCLVVHLARGGSQ